MDYPFQMMYKTTADGGHISRNPSDRWCAKQMLIHEINEGLLIPDEVQINCWCTRQIKEIIPYDVRNNCWEMTPLTDYKYQKICKTTIDGWDRIRNPYQMKDETTVDGWDQWRTNHARWCTEHLLMDETDDGIHTRWCTKQLMIDERNEGVHILEDVEKN